MSAKNIPEGHFGETAWAGEGGTPTVFRPRGAASGGGGGEADSAIPNAQAGRKLVRTADVEMLIVSYEETKPKIDAIVLEAGPCPG